MSSGMSDCTSLCCHTKLEPEQAATQTVFSLCYEIIIVLMDRRTISECQVSVCCKREGLRTTSSFTRKLSANLCAVKVAVKCLSTRNVVSR